MDLSGAHGTPTGKDPYNRQNRLCIVRVLERYFLAGSNGCGKSIDSRRLPPDTGASGKVPDIFAVTEKVLRFRHETGVLLQVNANTILNPRNYRIHRFVEYMLQKDGVDAVASDAHNCVSRPVNLEAAYQWLIHHTDAAYARKLVTFGGELV